jgi:hypothetical protein
MANKYKPYNKIDPSFGDPYYKMVNDLMAKHGGITTDFLEELRELRSYDMKKEEDYLASVREKKRRFKKKVNSSSSLTKENA